jgi:hypothetical protein
LKPDGWTIWVDKVESGESICDLHPALVSLNAKNSLLWLLFDKDDATLNVGGLDQKQPVGVENGIKP